MIARSLLAAGLTALASFVSAQTAPVADNIATSRSQTVAIISAAPVLEYSNSRGENIVSYFNANTWIQATTGGEELWRGDISVKRDGRVCMGNTNNCFGVEAVSDGWYIIGSNGLRADEKHMRYVGQN